LTGYLTSGERTRCCGCEACAQICAQKAIEMAEDAEGFRYPRLDRALCVDCGLCRGVCPCEREAPPVHPLRAAFGGYLKDEEVRRESTSGGAFSAIADCWCHGDYAIFGAAAEGLEVSHRYITDLSELGMLRKSKYTQSRIGTAYQDARDFLRQGKRVLFSGTPCQIAGLRAFLRGEDAENLLTVEVVCEGLPSPWFIRKQTAYLEERHGGRAVELDYRNKDRPKWDFEVTKLTFQDGRRIYMDRWVNPFHTVWMKGLMNRPSCGRCPYTAQTGLADITLGDLWRVHQRCPELYGGNRGASLVLCGTEKGADVLAAASGAMYGHSLPTDEVLSYQRRLTGPAQESPRREAFMADLRGMDFQTLCRRWAGPVSPRLLWSKYVWGNRQKVFVWNLKRRLWRRGR
jgi:coenzyme F420-reducing hydrogenase beta subunit